jgi:hypothetical protein
MANRNRSSTRSTKKATVRIVRLSARPFQLRNLCPVEKREVRISTGGRDEDKAEKLQSELNVKLLIGLNTRSSKAKLIGPEMEWSDFREQYRILHLKTLRERTAIDAASRLFFWS